MPNHDIWKDDITNRFPALTSLSDTAVGDGYIATAVFLTSTTNSAWQQSQWDAYLNLRQQLLLGEERPVPQLTSIQRDALTGITTGTPIFNSTSQRLEFWSGSSWMGAGGLVVNSSNTYGAMFEDNSSGSSLSVSTNYAGWVTAKTGLVGRDGLITFSHHAQADRLTIGVGGAGYFMVEFHASVTNSGGKLTTAAIHVQALEVPSVKMSLAGDSSKAVCLSSAGPVFLQNGQHLDLRFKSEANDTLTLFQVNVNIDRMEILL